MDPEAAANWPLEHAAQAEEAEDPVAARKVPEAQLKQADFPASVWYCPPGQAEHAEEPTAAAKVPTRQFEQAKAPARENVPAPQAPVTADSPVDAQ